MANKCKTVKNWCHCRSAPPSQFDKRSFRVRVIKPGVQVVVACPKGKWNPKGKFKTRGGQTKLGRCKVGMRTQGTRYSNEYLKKHHKRCGHA